MTTQQRSILSNEDRRTVQSPTILLNYPNRQIYIIVLRGISECVELWGGNCDRGFVVFGVPSPPLQA
jgi:hypothetical protein